MKANNEAKFYKLLSKVFNTSIKKITDRTCPENTPGWDSFNGLLVISELEKEFGLSFSVGEIVSIKNAGDIRKLLQKHKIKF